MPVLVSTSEGIGPTTTIRHSWRIELFSDFGQEVTIKAHREEVEYENETGRMLRCTKLGSIVRNLSDLPPGPTATVSALAAMADQWETEDAEAKGQE